MNKTEIIEHMAKHADITKAQARRAFDSQLSAIKNYLRRGGTVSIVGFGTFKVAKRAARTGRNPRTGEALKIRARKVPVFKAGKNLRDAMN